MEAEVVQESTDTEVEEGTKQPPAHEDDPNGSEVVVERPKFVISAQAPQPVLLAQYDCQASITRGCQFSPDGLCLLTNCEDKKMRIFETPPASASEPVELKPCLIMSEGEIIYDLCWYPPMDSRHPDTCCFASTAQYAPIHLYDAYDGHIRATYRCFDHLDEMVAAYSVAFDPQGQRLYAGLKNEIRVFDVAVPGRDCLSRRTWSKEISGPSGMISSIAVSPSAPDVYAIGTYAKSVGVYVEPEGELLCILDGQAGGITRIQFSPDGSKLLCGGRKDNQIVVWDLRNPGQVYAILKRNVETNQRIQFDIRDDMVISGGTDGRVQVWDLTQPPREDSEQPILDELVQWSGLHGGDCINGVTFNPHQALWASSSGQRHFPDISLEDNEETSAETTPNCLVENSFKLWKLDQIGP